MLTRIKNLFGSTPEKEVAADMYDRIVAAAREPVLYTEARVPDTVDGRFDLIALHAFILFHRMSSLEAWEKPGNFLAKRIMTDMDRSLREMGIGDMSIGKKMKKLARAFYGRLDAYWGAVSSDAQDALEEALIRNVYRADTDDDEAVRAGRRLADYVRRQIDALSGEPDERLLSGDVRFASADRIVKGSGNGSDLRKEVAE